MDFPVMPRQSKKGNIVAKKSPKRLMTPKTSALCLRITSLKHSWDIHSHTGRLPSEMNSTSLPEFLFWEALGSGRRRSAKGIS